MPCLPVLARRRQRHAPDSAAAGEEGPPQPEPEPCGRAGQGRLLLQRLAHQTSPSPAAAGEQGPPEARGPTDQDGLARLFHQTSPENAAAILASRRMRAGPRGYGGCGLYFAPSPQATTCKANAHGVILECVVRLGRVRRMDRAGAYCSRLRQLLLRYDSVALTFLEGGVEFVTFDPLRVVDIKVHSVLHASASGLSVGAGSLRSSSSGSLRIATAADPGACAVDVSGSSDGEGSFAAGCVASSSSSGGSDSSSSSSGGSSAGADQTCPVASADRGGRGASGREDWRAVECAGAALGCSQPGASAGRHPLSVADLLQHKLRTQQEQQGQQECRQGQQQQQQRQQRALHQALQAGLLTLLRKAQRQRQAEALKQRQQPARPCSSRALACC